MTPKGHHPPEGPDGSPGPQPSLTENRGVHDATLYLRPLSWNAAPDSDAPVRPVSRRAGRYPILRELGRGGMGVVYLAEDPTLGRTVAIKQLPDSMAHDAGRLERFRQEARLLASLNHPNIATIYSLEEADGVCFLTMETIEGETLGDRLGHTPLTLEESLRVGRQIARALEAAHKRGIVHRDLKPGNIMFTSDLEVKVLDFGLAAPAAAAGSTGGPGGESDSSLLEVSGTPGYMSPEQLEGAPSDPRMDIWAFGCVLFECLSGRAAIGGRTPVERMERTSTGDLDVSLLPGIVPAALRGMLQRCLIRNAVDRYPSITEPRQVIEELLAEISLQPRRTVLQEDRATGPNNLPRHGSTFIGRDAEIAEVARQIAQHRLVTLTGIGGAGKTRLALRVAQTLLETFADGAWFVELAPLASPDDIAGVILHTIGIPESLDRTPLEAIAGHLSSKQILLVLDNCEHLVEGAAAIVKTLLRDAPGVRVLVTSRERLALEGEVCYPVPLLDLPDAAGPLDLEVVARSTAIALFLVRARQAGSSIELNASTARTIMELCRRLDGIPLAIELAASRLKVLSVEEVLRRMNDRFHLLTGGLRGDLPHHRTLRALIDWSYEQLDPAEQVLLHRLSVFAGGWTLEAAEAVASGGVVQDWDLLDLCSRLVGKSLVEADVQAAEGTTRFRMLETVRAYAAERLEAGGEAADIRQRHRDYFVAFAARAEPEYSGGHQTRWFSRVAAEHEEIRRAFEGCRAPGADPALALRLAGSLFRYWMVRGHWSEADALSREALRRADALPPSADTAKVLNCVAAIAIYRGHLEEARHYWEKALAVWTALDHPAGIGGARLNLGNVAYSAGDYPAAARDYAEALESFRLLDQPIGISQALISLCNVALAQGDYEESRRCAREAVERLRRIGHAELTAHALIALGTAELRLESSEDAARHYQESLDIQKELGDQRNTAIATINLAVLYLGQKRMPEARLHFAEAASIFLSLGDVTSVASALEGLGTLAAQCGSDGHAVQAYGCAAAIRDASGMPRMPDEERTVETVLGEARLRIGEDRVAGLFAEGREMTIEAAVAWALREIKVAEG